MAQRRMFSLRIIDTARFLKMPVDTRELYFQLGLHADDDGVVEAYPILRQVGASEDNLKILVAKGFVQILNEDLITYVNDWQEHNTIRADRKIDSIYKNLLLQIKDESEIVQPRPRADKKKLNGQPMDNQWTTNGRHRLGKVRLDKDRINNKKTEPSFSQEILNITQYLYDNITNKPTSWIKKPPDLNKWAADIDKLNRIDGVPPKVIQKVIGYAMKDKFWQSIVQSGSGLRRNFNKIEMQMKANNFKKEPEETMKERLERIDRGDIRYDYKPGEETMKERLERIDRGDIRYE